MKRFSIPRVLASLSLVLVIGFSFAVPGARAAFLDQNTIEQMNDNTGQVRQEAGFDTMTLGESVALIIRAFLGLLGVIFIILLIIAGYNWMTAAGEEEKVKKATATIRTAIIGLLIIVASYAITYFVFANLPGGGN